MITIEHKGEIFAKIINFNDLPVKASQFFSDDQDTIQFAIHQPTNTKTFSPHFHLPSERIINHTQEVLVVLSGKLKATFYTTRKEFVDEKIIEGGEAIIILSGAHGFEVLSEDCKFLEIKNGPYLGADKDRKQI